MLLIDGLFLAIVGLAGVDALRQHGPRSHTDHAQHDRQANVQQCPTGEAVFQQVEGLKAEGRKRGVSSAQPDHEHKPAGFRHGQPAPCRRQRAEKGNRERPGQVEQEGARGQ